MHPHPEGFLAPFLYPYIPWFYGGSNWWTVLGFVAGFTFSGRFVLQWIHSEKAKKVTVPKIFWHLSFWGSVMNIIYLMHVDRAPLIFANCFLPFLYGRNLYLLYKHRAIHSPGDTGDD
ncbi:MAG: lipid-A-disaccharide synthase N-terminal domain-containing protein [Verrucomicrobiota bacterium]